MKTTTEKISRHRQPGVGCGALVRRSEPVGARSNESFRRLYEMSQSPQMEWSRATKEPFYYHSKYCSRKNGYDCGHDCSGSYGFHVAEDAADIRRAGWKLNTALLTGERKGATMTEETTSPYELGAASCSAGFEQTRNLTMDDVIIALQNIGLGSKLVNQALAEMGYTLIPFPAQNAEPIHGGKDA